MEPIEHVKVIEDAILKINSEGHIRSGDEWLVMEDLQKNVHKLRQVFEQEITNDFDKNFRENKSD